MDTGDAVAKLREENLGRKRKGAARVICPFSQTDWLPEPEAWDISLLPFYSPHQLIGVILFFPSLLLASTHRIAMA